MLRFTPPGRDRFIASTAGVRATIAGISVTVGATCAATVVHDASASASVSVSAQAKGHFTYFAIADVTISATAAGQRTAGGTANIGVDITASADATTFTAHSGTADVSVAIGATASATTITPIEGAATCSIVITASADGAIGTLHSSSTADCQVNISASANGFNTNTAVPDETTNSNTLYLYNSSDVPIGIFSTDAAIGTRSTEFLGNNSVGGTGYYGIIDDTFESTFQSSFSISVWVKFNSQTPTNNWILGNTKLGGDGGDNDNVALWFQEGTPRFWYRAGGVSKFTDASSYTANTDWTHVVATYDSSSDTTTLYLDGSSEATNTTSIDPTEYTNSVKMRVSKFEDADSNVIYTRKKIDDISIWSKTLSATEVSNLYNSGSGTDLAGSSDLVGWWKMGDHSVVPVTHSGTASVSVAVTASADGTTAQTHTGTASCSISVTASASGSASTPFNNNYSIYLDGTNDYATSSFDADTLIGTGDFTYSIWVKYDAITNHRNLGGLINSSASEFMRIQTINTTTDYIRASFNNNNSIFNVGQAAVTNGTWYNIVVTRTGTTAELWLNGVSQASGTDTDVGTDLDSATLLLGAATPSNLSYNHKGLMDEVAIWDEKLTDSEITAIYNSGTPINLTSNSGNYASSTNLVGWWRFEENTGTSIADSSTNSNTVTLNNGPTFSTDVPVFNQFSISLDGTNQYLSVSDHNDFSFGNSTTDSAFSVAAWVKMDDATKFRIFSKQTNSSNIEYVFGVDGLDRLGVNLYDGATSNYRGVYSSSIQSYEGSWIHVVMTYDGTGGSTAYNGMKLYLNGSALSTSNNQGGGYTAMHNTSTDVWIGGANFVPDYANGKIDEVAVFSAELTSTQVSNIYNNGTPTDLSSESNLVGYWRMEENTGTTVADSSGNGHTATLNNSPTFSTDVPS